MRVLLILILGTLGAMAQTLPAPVTDADYHPVALDEAKLGQLLFYDPILSGNRNISCATCHHPRFATGDGLSLSLGEGGIGLGPARRADPENMPEQRIPRHAQTLFNLGAREFTVLFHDGRIEADPERASGLRTPMEEEMLAGFTSLLSAQTMFPVLSADEMAGHYSENDVSEAVRMGRITGAGGAWDILSRRVGEISAYAEMFRSVYPHIESGDDIAFTDISNAIAAFVAHEWRSDDSAFDAWLRGGLALDAAAERGAALFYGVAGCSACHSGPFQTDHRFHAMGEPQFGPGKAARFETHQRDIGRMRVTGQDGDAYAFRTPSLRNVTRSAPYGHTGAYRDLDSFLAAHGNPDAAARYDRAQALLPDLASADDWWVLERADELQAVAAAAVTTQQISAAARRDLIAFLATLEDQVALTGRLGIPSEVPSGLPIER